MDSADTESFLHMMSPHITGDDDSMQLFADLDADSSTDMSRQQGSTNYPFTFSSSLPKSEDFEDANIMANGTTLSPESSLQDSISDSSNEQETFGNNIQTINNQNHGFNGNAWISSPQNHFTSITPNFSNLDDSNRVMESHFDFDSAASSPGVHLLDTKLVNRHVPAEQSPMSVTSPSVEDSTRATSPMSNTATRENQNMYNRAPVGFVQKSREVVPQSLPFGYRIDPRTITTFSATGNNHLLQGARPQLWIDTPKATSRVEIQIPIKLALYPFPQGIKKVHLQPYTISRPKFLAKPVHQPSPDTLELHAALVCASALSDPSKYEAAMIMAADAHLTRRRPSIRQPSKGKQAELKPGEDIRQGAEVWICDGCINRERKRNDRKKAKKVEDEEAWKEYENQRIIVFNTHEIKEWEMFSSPRTSDEQRHYPVPPEPPQGSMQVDLPMRIACYCRHHDEKQGFRVIFTLKSYSGEIIAQNITPSINITDDHKTASKESLNASLWNGNTQASDFDQESVQQNTAPFRNALSTTDLQRLQQSFSRPGFTSPFANPQNFSQQSQPSPTSRGTSRQASPTTNGPAVKKRKSSSNSNRLPESLKMTRLQHESSQMNDLVMSYPTSPASILSPNQTMMPDQQIINAQTTANYASPDANGFGSMHRSSRSQSYENLGNLQTMYSAPSSTFQSRAPSPGSAGPYTTTFGSQQIPSQMLAQMLGQTGSLTQVPVIPQNTPPIVHKVIPRHGPKAGGVEVTVVGLNFFNGLNVQFGDAVATTTTFWGSTTLVCLLPPARFAGKVPVTLHNSMDPLGTTNYSIHQGKPTKFEYVDDDEVELMRKALVLVGQKDTGRQEDAAEIARRIIGQNKPGSSSRGGSAMSGTYRQANGTRDLAMEKLDCETAVLKCLDLIDTSESPFPARYDLKGRNGQTILHLASSLGYYRLVSALLARGANPDARDKNGMSPIHMAALNDHLAIVRKLKYAGGDSTMRSLAGWTPADMASSHATYFALCCVGSFRSSNTETRPSSSQSAGSSVTPYSRHFRHMSREYHGQSDDESVTLEDSSGEDGENLMNSTDHATAVQQWAASRRNSGANILTPLMPSQLDPTGHRYMQLVAACRDHFAAQWQQLQQNFGLPPIALADYQNQTNLMTRGFGALRGSWPASTDSKERLQNESQRWWDFLTGSNSPPSYDEIYPASNSQRTDVKTESAARAALETEADLKCSKLYDTAAVENPALIPSSSTSVVSDNEADVLQQRRNKGVKRLRSDRKLFMIWIPLLILVVAAMLKDRIPEVKALVQRFIEYKSPAVETVNTTPLTMAEEIPQTIPVV